LILDIYGAYLTFNVLLQCNYLSVYYASHYACWFHFDEVWISCL